jgi:hypothetical protein
MDAHELKIAMEQAKCLEKENVDLTLDFAPKESIKTIECL